MFFYIMFGFTFVSGQNTFITTITNIKKNKKTTTLSALLL